MHGPRAEDGGPKVEAVRAGAGRARSDGGGSLNPTGTPPLEMMVDLRGGVGPPPRDDGACQGGVD